MVPFVFFLVFGSAIAVDPPKSGYPSADAPYFNFELQFLVVTAMRVETESQKLFCTAFYGVNIDEDNWNSSEPLCPPKTVINSCALHKILLVVFFHHRASLSSPQLSYSTNTGLKGVIQSIPPWLVLHVSLWLMGAVTNPCYVVYIIHGLVPSP